MTIDRCVVLGDVIGSREIADRAAFQRQLDDALATLNDEFATALAPPIQILKGVDEVGAVLESPERAYALARRLQDELFPRPIRVVCVQGRIDVNADGDDVASMDGPAFHEADEHVGRLADADLLCWLAFGEPPLEELLSMTANAVLTLRGDWTARQHDVVRAYEQAGTQTAAAARLDVGQPAVSKALDRTRYARVERIEATITSILEELSTEEEER